MVTFASIILSQALFVMIKLSKWLKQCVGDGVTDGEGVGEGTGMPVGEGEGKIVGISLGAGVGI